ncbi:MAG: short-chain dehydrogenase/reductase [Ilumatobacteraceae bacterium]|nr:short-chain dehydrogenase/reductase [Ilumatobacteraceae bacterium]
MDIIEPTDSTAIVTGASRGLGRGIATALAEAGFGVVGLARHAGPLDDVRTALGERFTPVIGDATDPDLASTLLTRYQPRLLVLNAGAIPTMGALPEQTWATFGVNWTTDVRHAFEWTRAALLAPLPAGSLVVVVSSGAALRGSPQSGGYAGAKAAVRFIASYAAEESQRAGLAIRFATLFPQLTPATELGAIGVAGYAERDGTDADVVTASLQPVLTPERIGAAIVALAAEPDGPAQRELLVTGRGLFTVPMLGQPQPFDMAMAAR